MRKLLIMLVLIVVLALSGCKETYESVEVEYVEYTKELERTFMVYNTTYLVTVEYEEELYICEWGSNPSHNEQGDKIQIFIELCDKK